MVGAFAYFFYAPAKIPVHSLDITHKFVVFDSLDRIVRDFIIQKISLARFDKTKEAPTPDKVDKADNSKIRNVFETPIFESKKYSSIHEISIINNGDIRIRDVEIINKFEYTSYLVDEDGDDNFVELSPGARHKISQIDPGAKISFVGISNFVTEYDPGDITILVDGKKQTVTLLGSSPDEILPRWFIDGHPFLAFMLFGMGIISIVLIALGAAMDGLRIWFPEIRAALIGKSEYDQSKQIVELYENRTNVKLDRKDREQK